MKEITVYFENCEPIKVNDESEQTVEEISENLVNVFHSNYINTISLYFKVQLEKQGG